MNARTFMRNMSLGLIVLAFAGAGMGATAAHAEVRIPAPQPKIQINSEARLSQLVRNRLVTLPWTGVFDNLEYKMDGSRVTLLGQVVGPWTKYDAQTSVKSIKGVTQVVNKIKILPLSLFDNHIRWAEYRAIFSQPALFRYSMGVNPAIHIIVDNGHVTLVGYVDSKMDRTIAGMRAKTVPFVFSVTNNLHVT